MKRTTEPSSDPRAHARLLERSRSARLSGDADPLEVRPVVAESWQRSLAARIDPDAWEPPVVFASDELGDVRESHPLARCLPLFRRTLLDAADDTTHIVIVTDAEGNILWREGHPDICRAADKVLLAEGTRWAESAIGTNAMGTTLATGAPVRIHSAEHLVRTYHSWTCAASPIRDPETGQIIGSLDISGPLHTMHPALMALVSATTQLAERELGEQVARRDERIRENNSSQLAALRGEPAALLSPSGRVITSEPRDLALPERVPVDQPDAPFALADGRWAVLEPLSEGYLLRAPRTNVRQATRPTLHLRFMGKHQPTAELNGRQFALSLRHAELLTALALREEGLNTEQLALLVHGEQGNPVTVRAQIHRLRAQLGTAVVRAKPYRIDARIEADFRTVQQALLNGDLRTALELHGQGLLPDSEAPGIRDEREELSAGLRAALLGCDDPDLLWDYAAMDAGRDDIELLERLVEVLSPGDWRRGVANARLERLLDDCD
ncbi:GAF domain-containing protein [Parasphingorhabdus pacifica]